MEDIIIPVLIFLLLGLFLNHFMPVIEGFGCTNDFVYSVDGEEGKLSENEQKEYNRLKAEKAELDNKPECSSSIVDKNISLLNSYKNNEMATLEEKKTKNVTTLSNSLSSELSGYNRTVKGLYDKVWPEEDNSESTDSDNTTSTTCGEINGASDLNVDGDNTIGSPIDTEGEGCN